MMSKAGGASPFSAGAVIAKKYRLRELLGEGTTGVVWASEDTTTGEDVALKLIVHPEPEARVHILRDAQACCAIVHDHVARVLDVGETGSGDPFLVMELLSGETLAQKLARVRKLGQREAAGLGRDIARALAAAHEQRVVHRNLKPANVFLHDAKWEIVPVVKVLDFGLGDDVVASAPSLDGAVGVVSSIHMSPEQLLGDESVDGRSDLWSLGVILYEMCTGAPLFEGSAVEAVRRMWAVDIPPLDQQARNVDASFSRLVMACLRRSPDQRPWPAADVADALESFSGPPERPSMTTLAELRASLIPPAPLSAAPAPVHAPAPMVPDAPTLVTDDGPTLVRDEPAPCALPRADADPTLISAVAPIPVSRVSPVPEPKKLDAPKPTPPAPARRRQRGRWSSRAALGAAGGAFLLSMVGITAIIVVSARGCSRAQSTPSCGERCAQRAP
jgi:serine/threonine protein kinase